MTTRNAATTLLLTTPLVLGLAVFAGCSSSDSARGDGDTVITRDTGRGDDVGREDTGGRPDVGTTDTDPVDVGDTDSSDTGPDTTDAAIDLGEDVTADTGPDTGPDVVTTDTGPDTSTDTNTDTDDNQAPLAFATVPMEGTVGTSLSFNGSASVDGDGTIVGYAWEFGDGAGAVGVGATHTYATAGTHSVTLTVTDDDGADGSVTHSIVISEGAGGYSGNFRVLPFDEEAPIEGACTDYSITVQPASCSITVAGSSMTMTCGPDTYRGTISGSSFTISMDRRTLYDANCDTDFYFTETITGTYISNDRWEGTTSLGLEMVDTFFCGSCQFDPFEKTGNRE